LVINNTFHTAAARLKSWVFPPHSVPGSTLYAASTLAAAVGRGLWLPFSLLYFHLVVGLPLPLVGAGLTGAGIVGLLLTPVAGSLVDHFGARPLFIASFAGVGVGSLVYLGAHSFSLFLVGAIVISSAYSFNMPAGTAYVAELFPPEDRDWWFGFDRSAMNLGLSVGVLLSGWVASVGGTGAYHWLLLVSAFGYFVTGALVLAIPASPFRAAASKQVEKSLSYVTVLRDRPFLGFIVTQATLFLSFAVLEVALPPFLVENLHAPAWGFSLLFTLNTIMVVVLQVPLMHLLGRMRRTRGIVLGGLSYAFSYLLFGAIVGVSRALLMPALVLTMIIYTLAEMFLSPTSYGLALALAPERARGRYMALLSLGGSLAFTVAPALFTFLLTLSSLFFWLMLAGITTAAALGVLLLERWLPPDTLRASPQEPEAQESEQLVVA
jgi:MFS family permease